MPEYGEADTRTAAYNESLSINNANRVITFYNVNIYEARSDYYQSLAIKDASGIVVYGHDAAPWSFAVICNEYGYPETVRFANGNTWRFGSIEDKYKGTEWPIFIADLSAGRRHGVRVTNFNSRDFTVKFSSENSVMGDVMVHAPR